MSSTVTLDGANGPGNTFQALAITGVNSIKFNPDPQTLELAVENGVVQMYDISTAATITITVSGRNYTVTIAD